MTELPLSERSMKATVLQAWARLRALDTRDPSSWPGLPRYGLFLVVAGLVGLLLWATLLKSAQDQLDAERSREAVLRVEYQTKLAKAVHVEALRKQREQVKADVARLETQLPSKAEMDALLSDINQAGLGRGLQFELFRPGQVQMRAHYAELPFVLKVNGRYHDLGAFVADLARLSRIVTLGNLSVQPLREGVLTLDATARTFRYLDAAEQAAQAQAAAPKPAKK